MKRQALKRSTKKKTRSGGINEPKIEHDLSNVSSEDLKQELRRRGLDTNTNREQQERPVQNEHQHKHEHHHHEPQSYTPSSSNEDSSSGRGDTWTCAPGTHGCCCPCVQPRIPGPSGLW